MTALWLDNLGSDQVIVTPYDLKKPTSDHTPNFTSIQTHTGAPLSPPTRNDFSRARNPENNHTNIITSSTLDLTQGNLTYEESENGLKVDGGRAGILPDDFHLPGFVSTSIDAFGLPTAVLRSNLNPTQTYIDQIIPTSIEPGGRFLSLFKAKMHMEEANDSNDQSRHNIERGQQVWEREMPFGALQEMDRMRHGNTVMNTQFAMGDVTSGSGGTSAGYAQQGMEGDESKPSAGPTSARSYSQHGSPRESPQIGGQWSPATSGPNLPDGRTHQSPHDQSFNLSPQIRSAPPSQTSFKLDSSPTPNPTYRPQSQQSAYFQRMIAAKLASDPAIRSESAPSSSGASAISNITQPWMNSTGSGDPCLPSSHSPMYQMLAPGDVASQGQHQQNQQREHSLLHPSTLHQHSSGMQQHQPQQGMPFSYTQQWPPYHAQPVKPENTGNASDSGRFNSNSRGPTMLGYNPGTPAHQQHISSTGPYGAMQMASSGQQYGSTDGGYRDSDGSQSSHPAGTSHSRHGDDGEGMHGNGASNGGGGNAGGSGLPSKDIGKDGTPKKAVLACHFCRGRKLKCDGERPTCSHCQRRNLTCSYDTVIRRRGPGKKKKGSHDPEQAGGSGEGSGDGDQPSEEKPPSEGKKRGRKPKDPNAPPKRRVGDLYPNMQPVLPPPHPGYAPYAGPPMHAYPPNHPYHPNPYAPYPNAFHPGPPDSYIDPILQTDRRMDFPSSHGMPPPDHRYDYPQHPAYMSRPMPHDVEEPVAKRPRYPGDPSLPDPSMPS